MSLNLKHLIENFVIELDNAFFQKQRFLDCDDFKNRLSFLSAIVYDFQWDEDNRDSTVQVWKNPNASFTLSVWFVSLLCAAFSTPFNTKLKSLLNPVDP